MSTYHKIPNIFKRSPDGKRVLFGEFTKPEFEFLKDVPWNFTEKVDGTNIRVIWNGYNFEFKGRTDRAQIPNFLFDKLKEIWLPREEIVEEIFSDKQVIFYGEGYGPKINKGHRYRDDVSFIMFDIKVEDVFLTLENMFQVSSRLGIKHVPLIYTGTLLEAVELVKKGAASVVRNKVDKDVLVEGLVGKPVVELYNRLGKRIIVKILTRDFLENKEDFVTL